MAEPDYTSPELIARERQEIGEFFRTFPFFKLTGIELVEIEPGRAKLSIAWRPDLTQPAGILHGGMIATLVDTCVAHSILLTAPYLKAKVNGGRIVSVDLRIKYLRPVSSGKVICEARVVRMGRQIIHTSAVVTDPDGKDVALGDSIYTMVTAEQLRKRAD